MVIALCEKLLPHKSAFIIAALMSVNKLCLFSFNIIWNEFHFYHLTKHMYIFNIYHFSSYFDFFVLQRLYHLAGAHSIFVTGLEFASSETPVSVVGSNADFTLFSISADNQVKLHQQEARSKNVNFFFLLGSYFFGIMSCNFCAKNSKHLFFTVG